jgi:hypothetical protein
MSRDQVSCPYRTTGKIITTFLRYFYVMTFSWILVVR